jgi:hypothetical protein
MISDFPLIFSISAEMRNKLEEMYWCLKNVKFCHEVDWIIWRYIYVDHLD